MSLTDEPIKSREEDLLGHYDIAKDLADWVIDDEGRATGEVYGLVGGWGTGKSGVLNLLEQEIKDRYAGAIVVRFNPWLITSREGMDKRDTLVKDFLLTLYEALDKARGGRGQRDKVLNALADYAIALSPAIKPLLYKDFDPLGALEKVLKRHREGSGSLHTLKEKLETALKTTSRPIIVLIDELDRIDDDEIMAMLQMVKAVMQIQGISYVVAYEEESVLRAVAKSLSIWENDKYAELFSNIKIKSDSIDQNLDGTLKFKKDAAYLYLEKIIKDSKKLIGNSIINFVEKFGDLQFFDGFHLENIEKTLDRNYSTRYLKNKINPVIFSNICKFAIQHGCGNQDIIKFNEESLGITPIKIYDADLEEYEFSKLIIKHYEKHEYNIENALESIIIYNDARKLKEQREKKVIESKELPFAKFYLELIENINVNIDLLIRVALITSTYKSIEKIFEKHEGDKSELLSKAIIINSKLSENNNIYILNKICNNYNLKIGKNEKREILNNRGNIELFARSLSLGLSIATSGIGAAQIINLIMNNYEAPPLFNNSINYNELLTALTHSAAPSPPLRDE